MKSVRQGSELPGEFIRYFAVSALALGFDLLVLHFLVQMLGIHYVLAASASFMAGALVHYVLSVSMVFRKRRMLNRRAAEMAIFVAIGLAALIVNVGLVAVGVEVLGASLTMSKLFAAAGSFLFGFVIRKMSLF